MTQYVTYDKTNNVLFADYTNLTITPQIFDHVVEETRQLSAKLPQKVYFLACLNNSKITPELQAIWGEYTQKMLQYVRGVIRYEANDVITNITIRSNTVRYRTQGHNSHIYPSKEEAIAAIRQMEQSQKQ